MGYQTRPELRAKVMHLDSVGLLKSSVTAKIPEPEKEGAGTESNVKSLSDIFDDDDHDLLDDIDTSIYALKHVFQNKELSDEIASRKPSEDFFRYEKFFQDIHKVLPTKMVMKERIVQESDAKVEQIFILNGLLCLVDSTIKKDTGKSKRKNPRLRVIFENGTEIDLLKRSLTRALYKDKHGRRVNFDLNLFANGSISISHKDKPTGYVYILSSETKAPHWYSSRQPENSSKSVIRHRMSMNEPRMPAKPTSNRMAGGLSALPLLDGVSYEIVSAQDGRECILATGNTATKKEQLSAAGFHWNPQRKIWWKLCRIAKGLSVAMPDTSIRHTQDWILCLSMCGPKPLSRFF